MNSSYEKEYNLSRNTVFLINSFGGGGAERALSKILQDPVINDGSLTLVTLDHAEFAYKIPNNIKHVCLNTNGSFIKSVFKLVKYFKANQPGQVMSFLARANCCNVIAGKLLNFKTIISERTYTSSYYNNSISGQLFKFLIRALYPKADKIVAVSKGVAQDLEVNFSVNSEKITVLYNCYINQEIIDASNEEVVDNLPSKFIVAVGRLQKVKNFSMLIEAYSKVATSHKLVLLGDGPELNHLKNIARINKVEDKVVFYGHATNPYSIVSKSSLFVLSSNTEGFPNALAEAMVLSKPIVATNCMSGPSEILEGEVTLDFENVFEAKYGFLTPVDDAISMSKAITKMLKEENLNKFKSLSYMRSQDFSQQVFFEKLTKILD